MLLLLLTSCELTLPSAEEAFDGKLTPSLKLKVRERRLILPGTNTGMPPPEAGILKSQCQDLEDGGPLAGPSCITDTLACGETIIGHTEGGVKRYDSRFYEAHFCTPYTTNHDSGDERVYRLDMPDGDWTAVVTLDTPCADLDLAAIRWNGDECPGKGHIINQCEMWPKDGTAREHVDLVSQRRGSWYIVVEGKNEEEGAFALTVQCRPGLN